MVTPNLPSRYPGLSANEWRYLIVDGHNSHYGGEFQWNCIQNKVSVVYLLPHMSHLIQPCDIGRFVPLKRFYTAALKEYTPQGCAVINRSQFSRFYKKARDG